MRQKYNWKRFWAPPETQISLTDNGLLEDPTGRFGQYVNPDVVEIIAQKNTNCLVLLGEPGIGKSVEIEEMYNSTISVGSTKALWINLKNIPSIEIFREELEKNAEYQGWINNENELYLFLDSFDEGIFSFKSFANYFNLLLTKNLAKLNRLYLRISCRTAVWPSYFDDSLQVLWGKKQFKKYELCPLTRADVISALKSRGIESDTFLAQIKEKGVVALAGKPLTLQMLMSVFEQNGSLPRKKSDIYTQGCNLLIQEPDASKKVDLITKPKLSLTQRIAIAERIAFTTIIGGKPIINLEDVSTSEGELNIADLQGKEIVNNTLLTVGDDQILEVLNTGLFSSRGNGKMGWAHQTYGEFLAARYLERHQLNWKQVRSLLFQDPLRIGAFQVIPQLYEVSAWLANIDSSFFDNAVLLDPEFLMLSDGNVISDKQKEALTAQLLLKLANGELFDRWETFNYANYRKLCHPKIKGQLEPYISDPAKGIVVRRAAIDIASACETSSLANTLVGVATNKKENLTIRVRATQAIAEIGSDATKEKLKSLLSSGFTDDPEDELKGVTLRALWPKHISAKEIFRLLTPPKKHNFLGTYYSFTEKYLVANLDSKDLSIALDWVEANALHQRNIEYYLGKAADEIMLKAWENISIPEILNKFSEIVLKRLMKFESMIGENAIDNEVVNTFKKSLETDNAARQKLIKEIVLRLTQENETDRKGYFLFPHKERLIFNKDLVWLIDWLTNEKNEEIQKILAEVISRLFSIQNAADIELIIKARETNKFLKDLTSFWFETVDLTSAEAKRQKKQWEDEQKWSKERDKDEKEEILKVVSPDKINELLEKAETGDTNSWWILNNNMCMYQHEIDEEDIEKLPGWKVIKEEIQLRIIQAGRAFIKEQESKPEMWLGKGKIYYPALAGYRAFHALYKREREFVESLDKEIWKKWAPILIGMPLISNKPENGKLVTIAYKNAPEEIIKTLDVLIDEEEQRHGNIFLIDLLEGCLDEKMIQFLLDKSKKKNFKIKARQDILRFLLKHRVTPAKAFLKSLVEVPLPTDLDKKENSLMSAASLLWNADSIDWKYLWSFIQKDLEFGKLLIEKAHENPLRGTTMLQGLSEFQLAELYIWLMNNFPPEKYSSPEGGYTVTPQISIGEWRDSVLRVLVDKGTGEACTQIQRISVLFPQHKWIKEYTLLEARRIALQKSWKTPETEQLLKLVENHDLRLVNTPDELMDIVLDSIEDLERKLQRKEQPEIIDLWNEKTTTVKKTRKQTSITYAWPKDEGRLSDKIKTHLEENLPGIVIGREVEIKRGSKTDIHISTVSKDHLGRPKDLMKVIVEVKGCWNDELDCAMETQLVKKYLLGTGANRGIYLIGWFKCDKWNDPDPKEIARKKKCPKFDIPKANGEYKKQAIELSSQNAIRLEAVILDCRL